MTNGFAADTEAGTVAESTPLPLQTSAGHVEGYMTLPLGDEVFDATFVADKTGRDYGKVLILPDQDGSIDSYDLVHTLRMRLAESGWSTMTVALSYPNQPQLLLSPNANDEEPAVQIETTAEAEVSENASTSDDDNAGRVAAAVAYLNAQQPGPTVIIAMGKSAELSATAIAQVGKDNALIWISPEWQAETAPEAQYVLDITLSDSAYEETTNVQQRAVMMRKNVVQYSQRQIPGATSNFNGFEQPVFNLIRNWLHKSFAQGATS